MESLREGDAPVNVGDIGAARAVLQGVIVPTPMLPSLPLSEEVGGHIFVKAESMQRTGSFKPRGAYTRLFALGPEQLTRGVVAASAGNHAQGVALAAQILGTPATIVMPEDAPLTKVTATQSYGAEVVLHGRSFDEAGACARSLAEERGLTLVHAFNDPLIIAGQGTVGLEILEALPHVGTIVVPIGGGGLIGGIAIAVRARTSHVRIVGVQAGGCPSVGESLASGGPVEIPHARTIADGIAVKRPGDLTLPLIRDLVDRVVTVDEDEIAAGIVYSLQRLGLVAEGAGAVGIAALLAGKVVPRAGEDVCVVLSGRNIDANLLARVIEQVLVKQGRYIVLQVSVPDRPGNLARLAAQMGDQGANVIEVAHRRAAWGVPVDRTGIELVLEVRDREHGRRVVRSLADAGLTPRQVEAGMFGE